MSYHPVAVTLTEHHKHQLAHAHQHKQPVTIRLAHHHMHGGDVLHLTATQIKHLQKAKNEGRGADVKISSSQIKKVGGKMGGARIPKVSDSKSKVRKGDGMFLPGTGLMLPGTGLTSLSKMNSKKPKVALGGHMTFDVGKGLFIPNQTQNVSRVFKDVPHSMAAPIGRMGNYVSSSVLPLTSGEGLDDIHGTQLGRRGQGLVPMKRGKKKTTMLD